MKPRHSTEGVRVLVADSNLIQNQLLTRELQRQAGLLVTGCASEITDCQNAIASFSPEVVLWAESSQSNSIQILDAIRELVEMRPNVRFVVLLESWDSDSVVNAFRAGVRGIFSRRDGSIKSLHRCILSVHEGQIWATSAQMVCLIEALKRAPVVRVVNAKGKELLTPRQRQLVELVAEGLGNREIARQMNVSENTTKKSLLRIFDKIGVSNRVELVLCALAFRRNEPGRSATQQRPGPVPIETAVHRAKLPAMADKLTHEAEVSVPRVYTRQ